MSGRAVFRCGLVLAGFVLGASSVAEAKVLQSSPAVSAFSDVANPNGLGEYLDQSFASPPQSGAEVTKTITLNFGPLHFQEILKSTPKSCRS